MLKAAFIGCVQSSETALRTLIEHDAVEVAAVLTLRQSRFNADFVDLRPLAREAGIEVHDWEDMDSAAVRRLLTDLQVDIAFCIGFSRLLDASILSAPPLGVVGFHPAALPRNRGRHPIIWALALGLQETASTLFRMDERADAGPLLSQVPVAIGPDEDAGSLYRKILEVLAVQVAEVASGLASGTLIASPQDESSATSWRKRSAADGRIDWRMSARSIDALVRALTRPYVGADFALADQPVKVWRTRIVEEVPRDAEPGKVLAVDPDGVVVRAGEQGVRLVETDPVLTNLSVGDYL